MHYSYFNTKTKTKVVNNLYVDPISYFVDEQNVKEK